MRFRRPVIALAAGIAVACTTDTAIGPKGIKSLVVTPADPVLVPGDTVQLFAVATDDRGIQYIISGTAWGSSDAAVATTTAGGHIVGVAPGTATITASVSGSSATTTVTVTPPPVIALSRDSVPFTVIVHGTVPPPQTVEVTNTGGGTLSGVTDSIAYTGADSGWLQVSLSGPTAPDTLTLAPTRSDLTVGTHTASVYLRAPKASNSPQIVKVTYAVNVGAPTTIVVDSGNGQTAPVNTAVPKVPVARVFDAFNNPVPGVSVTFAVATGGGAVVPTTAVLTDANGRVRVTSWMLGTSVGGNSLTATAAPLPTTPVTFVATAVAGAPAHLQKVAGDSQSATVGATVPVAPTVKVTDQFGNAVGGATVTFAVTAGGGGVSGGTPSTDGAGVASVGAWTFGTTAGAQKLRAAIATDTVTFSATATPAGASLLVLSAGDGQTATVGTAVAIPPRVKVTDPFGNPVAGVAVSFAVGSGGGTVTGPSATTDTLGLAAVGSWTLGTVAGANSLSATASGLTGSPLTFTATGAADVASQIALNAGDGQSATVNAAVATAPSVIVKDQYGNPVQNASVTFAVTSGGGTVNPTVPVLTNASGIAAPISWTLGTSVGANSLTATASGLAGSPVTFSATATVGPASQIALSAGNGQSATVNTAVATAPSVVVTDQFGNPVQGIGVTFAVTSGGGTVNPTTPALTNASGIATATGWTLGTTAGANTLTATATGLTGSPVTFTATGTAGAATQIAINAGNGQSAPVNTAVATAPSVIVKDQFGNPVAGVSVTFAVTTGGGSLTGAGATSNASGIAAVGSWTLGNTVGGNTMTATSIGLAGSPLTFTATGTAGAATQMALNAGDGQSAPAGSAVAVAPSVIVKDQFGNPVAGVSVTFSVATGGGSVTGSVATSNASGIATVGSWTLGTVVGSNTLTATSAGLTGSPVTFTATATTAPAAQIALNAGNGQSATVNTAVATAPSVIVKDGFGNPVSGVAVTFAVVTGGGSVNPTTPVLTNASGIATTTSWTLGTTAGANTLTATSTGLNGSPVTFTATGTAGTATQLALNAGDGQSATVNTTVATAPSVIVKDQFGNPVAGVSVTFAVATGGGSVTGAGALSNASGIATVGSWKLGTAAGSNTLTASSTGLSGSPVTFTATGSAGAATQIAKSAGDSQSAIVGTAVSTPPAVRVTDQYGNPAAGIAVTFAVASGGGSLTGGKATTNASGIATVGSWTLGAVAGANSLTATSAGLTGSPLTFTATGVAAAATTMAAAGGNGQTDTIGATLPTPYTVVVTDGVNPVPGVPVAWAVSTGGGSLTSVLATTDANGHSSATHVLGTLAGAQSVTATVGGLSGSPVTFTSTATHGNATTVASLDGSGQSDTIGATLANPYRVTVTDRGGNPVPGATITWSATLGGSITASSITNASGIASATRTLGTTIGATADQATAAGLNGSPVAFTATVTPGHAKTIALAGGDAQTDTVGKTLPVPYTVSVTDRAGNAVPGVTVSWAVTSGGGSITPSSLTNGSGIASATRVLGNTAGSQTATASVTGLSGSPITFTATALAGAAKTIALSGGDAQTDTIGSTLAPYSVVVTDAGGNPVGGVTVTWAVTGGGTITPLSPTTNTSGIASATRVLGNVAGPQGATATAGGLLGSPVAFTATATAGNAKTIALAGGNSQTDTIGATLATPYTVLVGDRAGNPVANVTVSWAATGGVGSIAPAISSTDAAGIASAVRTLGSVLGSETASATATGLTGSPIGFSATVVHGNPATIAVSGGDAQTDTIGATLTIPYSVTVKDRAGNAAANVTVNWSAGGGGSITTSSVTNGSGVATASRTLGTTAGTQTAQADVGFGVSPAGFTATATHGNAKTIALAGGNALTDTIGATLTTPLSVLVTDRGGNAVPGVTVNWAGSGGATPTPLSGATDGSGIASVSLTLGTVAGPQGATATSGTLTGSPVTFTETALAGHATQIAVNGGDAQSAAVNTAVATAPSAIVRDRAGNPVQGTSVTFAVTGGSGSVVPTSAILTNSSGIAQVTSWTLGTLAGTNNNTLSATSVGLSGSPLTYTASATPGPVSASTSTVTAGTASITACSVSCVAGTTASVITVTVKDQFGNLKSGISVTASGSPTTGNSFTNPGASGTTDVNGQFQATFNSTKAEVKTISADAGGTTITQQPTVTVNPDVVSLTNSLISGTSPITASSGSSVSTVTVTVRDQFSNPISGKTVTLSVSPVTGNTVTQPASTTNGSGVATGSFFTTKAETKTVSASVTGSGTLTPTATVTVNPDVVSLTNSLVAATTPITASSGSSLSTVTVTVRDQFSNPISGKTVTLSVSPVTGNTVNQPGSTTNGAGVTTGTFSSTKAETKTVTASVTGSGALSTTPAVVVNAAAAASIAVNGGNGQTAHISAAVATAPSAIVRDAFANPVAGVAVTFSVTAGGGSVTGATPTTNASGIATVGSWTLQGTGTENAQGAANAGTSNNTLSASAAGAGSTSFSGFGFYALAADVQPIYDSRCALSGCHISGGTSPNLAAGSSFGSTVGVTANCDNTKFRVNSSAASTSVVYLRVSTTTECGSSMPPGTTPGTTGLSAAQQQIIRMWINRAAQNN